MIKKQNAKKIIMGASMLALLGVSIAGGGAFAAQCRYTTLRGLWVLGCICERSLSMIQESSSFSTGADKQSRISAGHSMT